MKSIALLSFLIILSFSVFAQKKVIDSLYKDLASQKSDTAKAITLYNLSYYYNSFKPDSAMLLAQRSYILSKKSNFLRGQSWALSSMANAFHALHNYPKAIEYFIAQLKIEEKRENPANISSTYLNMALVYNSEKEVNKALFYAFKSDSIAKANKFEDILLYVKLNIGDIYEKAGRLPEAMVNTMAAYQLAVKQKNGLIGGTALNNLGNIYLKKGNYIKANQFYRQSIPFLIAAEDYNTLAECKLGLAKIFKETGDVDSAIFYSKQVYNLSVKNEIMARAVNASALLAKIYKGENRIDSAFAYQETMLKLTDSLDNKERAKAIESITIAEEVRQKEILETKEREAEDRAQKLQLLAIGAFIPIFFFVSVFLSRRKVSQKVIEFSGILSLLMVFEYLTLFIHPFVAERSHHSPLIEIIVFVGIAALLTPTHHKIEHWLIHKLSKIREHHIQIRAKVKEKPESEEISEDSITS